MRRGYTITELAVLVPVALLVLGVALFALARMSFQGTWNGSRLGATDAALVHLEKMRVAAASGGLAAAQAVRRPPAVAEAAVEWRDAERGVLEVNLTAHEGRGLGRAAPVRVTARVHLADVGARAAFGSWADE